LKDVNNLYSDIAGRIAVLNHNTNHKLSFEGGLLNRSGFVETNECEQQTFNTGTQELHVCCKLNSINDKYVTGNTLLQIKA
jgi:hypothetical protein